LRKIRNHRLFIKSTKSRYTGDISTFGTVKKLGIYSSDSRFWLYFYIYNIWIYFYWILLISFKLKTDYKLGYLTALGKPKNC